MHARHWQAGLHEVARIIRRAPARPFARAFRLTLALAGLAALATVCPATESPTPAPHVTWGGFVLADAGLRTPESVLHDPIADVYLVSNVNGAPDAKDDNGFISRVSPDGRVLAIAWIDGAAKEVTLNAPKGMALHGDSLFVADIDAVRIFSRTTGEPRGAIPIAEAVFLNDLAVSDDGTLYVSDMRTNRIHRIGADMRASVVVHNASIAQPNGLTICADTLWIARSVAARISALDVSDDKEAHLLREVGVPAAGLDGLVRLPDGTLLVSSWVAQSVYRIAPSGEASLLFDHLPAPADIGLDFSRGLLLIPFFNDDKIEARPLDQAGK